MTGVTTAAAKPKPTRAKKARAKPEKWQLHSPPTQQLRPGAVSEDEKPL